MSNTDRHSPRSVQIVDIDADTAGQRLDNFLMRHLRGLPKSRVYRIIRKGEVRINGRRARPDTRLVAGDQVRIPPLAHLPARSTAVGHFFDVEGLVLHEDDNLLVINKPAGMAVHGGSGVSVGVIESLRHAHPDGDRLELVHRLDRGTSGCLMVSKRRRYLRLLQAALRRQGVISKHYLALVHGVWPESLHRVDEPLQVTDHAGMEKFTRVSADGKPAVTLFEALATDGDLSLVRASPQTGRTHQIRVHARWVRHPLVGDERYGDEARDRLVGVSQLMLHAAALSIPALEDFPAVQVQAPPEAAFQALVKERFGDIDLYKT